jgi:hypothetical protein
MFLRNVGCLLLDSTALYLFIAITLRTAKPTFPNLFTLVFFTADTGLGTAE